MAAYLIKRLLLMVPTLFGIMLVSFVIIQFAPGGPVEKMIAQLTGMDEAATARIGGGQSDMAGNAQIHDMSQSAYRGAQGLDPAFIKQLEVQFGFDKPAHERFWLMLKNFVTFDLGKSYYRDISVLSLIKEKLPVSISLGIWMTLLAYLISIPLGIRKAVRAGERFDVWTSGVLVIGYAVPGFMVAVFLLIFFAGGSFLQIFPSRGLYSDTWAELSTWGKIVDYVWHLVLPLTAMGLASFTLLTFMTKNAFLDEIRKQYVVTARAKGLSERSVLYGHVFRNAMLLIIAGFPAAFIGAFTSGSVLIETIFSLDGLGRLGFESAINRDYPVVFGALWIFSIIALVLHLITDFVYTLVDPRIDFETRET